MREREEYLSEREIYVLDNHPQMSYEKLGEVLGITGGRVRQIKHRAERLIREDKQRELIEARGEEVLQVSLKRNEVWLLNRSLNELAFKCVRHQADMRRKDRTPDPDLERIERLRTKLSSL